MKIKIEKETQIALAALLLFVLDLWGWVPFESNVEVDWFLLTDSQLTPHWYIKFTTSDLLLAFPFLSIYWITNNSGLKRVSKYIVAYVLLKLLMFWCFHYKFPMTPAIIILFLISTPAILLGSSYSGLRKSIAILLKKIWRRF